MPVASGIYYSLSELGQPGSTPIILIHGAGGSYLGWHTRIRRMPGFNIYSLDLPGHGKSGGEGRQSIQAYSEDIQRFMQSAGIYQTVLAGHSLGGMIALQSAASYPERIAGLVLVSCAAYCPIPEHIVQGLINSLTYSQSMDWLIDHLAGGSEGVRWAEATRRSVEQTRRGVLYGDLAACHAADQSGLAAEVQTRALVCCGDRDKFFPYQTALYLARSLPHARSRVFPGCGHLLPLECPDLLAAELQAFILESN